MLAGCKALLKGLSLAAVRPRMRRKGDSTASRRLRGRNGPREALGLGGNCNGVKAGRERMFMLRAYGSEERLRMGKLRLPRGIRFVPGYFWPA